MGPDLDQATGPHNLISPALDCSSGAPAANGRLYITHQVGTQTFTNLPLDSLLSVVYFVHMECNDTCTIVVASVRTHVCHYASEETTASQHGPMHGFKAELLAADHTVLPWSCTIYPPSLSRPIGCIGPHDDALAWAVRP